MPKVLVYIVKRIMWLFLFYDTDSLENRAHVHVGKKGSQKLCKIWLEPQIQVDKKGDLTEAQLKEIVELTEEYRDRLIEQWRLFKEGKQVKLLKITK
jgi:hypothetical protein